MPQVHTPSSPDVPHIARARRRPAPVAVTRTPVLRLQDVGLGAIDLSFTAHAGEIVHLSGGSPMARLRLLALAAGFDTGGSGSCALLGLDLRALEPERRRALRDIYVARVLACDQLPNAASVLASIALPLVRHGLPITDALARAGLELDALGAGDLGPRHPDSLARGEARLALIARATAQRPRLLVLEQPEDGLAPAAVSSLRLALWSLASTFNTCIVMSTAHPRLAASADRHIDLDRGTPRVLS